ncbi:MAG TPA: proton-conducting transporter membrane subunit [Myxococcota bacterium]|nr:proton-conducting transporter membrane subunit [Myxococcota bacterium]
MGELGVAFACLLLDEDRHIERVEEREVLEVEAADLSGHHGRSLGGDGRRGASLAGLYRRAPLIGVVLLAGLFGLAGVPPTPGFTGKWFLFSAAMDDGYFWVVLIGAVNATISLYYYLRVVKAAYQTTEEPPALVV